MNPGLVSAWGWDPPVLFVQIYLRQEEKKKPTILFDTMMVYDGKYMSLHVHFSKPTECTTPKVNLI